jgi:hypothetical protein
MATRRSEASYTKPQLRERLKEQIKQSDKGGRPGQWSARKSQLLVQQYEAKGGGYTGERTEKQKDLRRWTKEEWQTKDGAARARHGKETERYLPKKAWEKLSPAEREATDKKKRTTSRSGKQFVPNTQKAKAARRSAKA